MAGQRRLALLVLAPLLLALFLGFAIAQGIGEPDIPSGAVAVVEDAPEGTGTISEEKFEHAIEVAAAKEQIEPVPKPGDEKYEELQEAALGELFDIVWIQGQAEEMGISVTPKEVEQELEILKNQNFETEKQYEEFLEKSHYTAEDVNLRAKVQTLNAKIEKQLKEEVSKPSSSEIEDYYEAAKSSLYTTAESRDIRIVVNKDKAKVEEAKAALEKDSSVKSWKKIAKRYSSDATKSNGGLQPGVVEGQFSKPLSAAIFATPKGELKGLVQESSGYVVFEVAKINPKVSSLEEVESQISSQLFEQSERQDFADLLRNYNTTWESRTFCAPEVTIKRCANFKGSGHPLEADPACYEADPEEPAEACPAPVIQVKPVMPGSITLLVPDGQKLAQRPHPPGDESAPQASSEALGAPSPVE